MNLSTHARLHALPSPSWRWELAVELVEQSSSFRRSDDRTVRAAKRFWLSWITCSTERDQRLLATRMPVLYQAYSLFQASGNRNRHALEARLLAAESPAAIARKSALPLPVVDCFEQLFFDVRAHLRSPDYILHRVIGPLADERANGWNAERTWKLFAYLGGVRVLEELMNASPDLAKPTNPMEVAAFLSDRAREVMGRQLTIAAHVIKAGDRATALELMKLQMRLCGGNRDEENGGGRTPFEQHIAAMLAEIPFGIGRKGEKMVTPKVAEFDQCAAELTAEELLRLSAGEALPELEELKELKLPPPRKPRNHPLEDGTSVLP